MKIKQILHNIPKDGCLIVFNAYEPSWRAMCSMVKCACQRCSFILCGKIRTPYSQYMDLYITPKH